MAIEIKIKKYGLDSLWKQKISLKMIKLTCGIVQGAQNHWVQLEASERGNGVCGFSHCSEYKYLMECRVQ